MNADISMDNFIAGTAGYPAGAGAAAKATRKRYFGAEHKDFGWSAGNTKGSMDRVDAIRTRMAQYTDADLLPELQKELEDDVLANGIAATQIAAIRRLMRGYCILEASVRETAPSARGLTKDMALPENDARLCRGHRYLHVLRHLLMYR